MPTKREKSKAKILELLDDLEHDPSLQHLPEVLADCLSLLRERDRAYNQSQTSYYNTFTNGDAEAFINLNQTTKRLEGLVVTKEGALRIEADHLIDDKKLIDDNINWGLLWKCHRKERCC